MSSLASYASAREGVIGEESNVTEAKDAAPGAQVKGDKSQSSLTIGTLFGVAVPLYSPTRYEVRGKRVVLVAEPEKLDYIQPAAYILPSIAIYSWKTAKKIRRLPNSSEPEQFEWRSRTLSLILPAGLVAKAGDSKSWSVGAGVALGWTGPTGAEVGVALAMVWQQVQALSPEQRDAYVGGKDLVEGANTTLDTKLRPSLCLGVYLAPTF